MPIYRSVDFYDSIIQKHHKFGYKLSDFTPDRLGGKFTPEVGKVFEFLGFTPQDSEKGLLIDEESKLVDLFHEKIELVPNGCENSPEWAEKIAKGSAVIDGTELGVAKKLADEISVHKVRFLDGFVNFVEDKFNINSCSLRNYYCFDATCPVTWDRLIMKEKDLLDSCEGYGGYSSVIGKYSRQVAKDRKFSFLGDDHILVKVQKLFDEYSRIGEEEEDCLIKIGRLLNGEPDTRFLPDGNHSDNFLRRKIGVNGLVQVGNIWWNSSSNSRVETVPFSECRDDNLYSRFLEELVEVKEELLGGETTYKYGEYRDSLSEEDKAKKAIVNLFNGRSDGEFTDETRFFRSVFGFFDFEKVDDIEDIITKLNEEGFESRCSKFNVSRTIEVKKPKSDIYTPKKFDRELVDKLLGDSKDTKAKSIATDFVNKFKTFKKGKFAAIVASVIALGAATGYGVSSHYNKSIQEDD